MMIQKRALLIPISVAVSAVIGFFVAQYLLQNPPLPLPPRRPDATLAIFITLKSVISFCNIALLLALVAVYGSLCRQVRTRFTLGLLLLVIVLLLYAVSSNPVVHYLLGYPGTVLGPFTIVPDIFALLAFALLLYLSQE
ncbi:MAG: hypothetical protein ACTSUH_10155 [Candidatus Thorarchaeota archaeon]